MANQQKIDINEVSKEDLVRLPGVGEVAAEAIIEFRDRHGRINDIGDLATAERIHPKEIESLREWLRAGSESG